MITRFFQLSLSPTRIIWLLAIAFCGLIGFTLIIGNKATSQDMKPGPEDTVEIATFAGGCFWCMEPPYEKLDGVYDARSGFMGGQRKNPEYKEVASGKTDHLEVVQVRYDSSVVSYKKLLEVFWRQIDPTDDAGQFVDRGNQYRSRIFHHTQRQKQLAQASKQELQKSGPFQEPIVTTIKPAKTFYEAPDYHQDYYKDHSIQYKFYRYNSGRDDYLDETWDGYEDYQIFSDLRPESVQTKSDQQQAGAQGSWVGFEKPSDQELRNQLTDIQYKVTQQDGTEPPHNNKYHEFEKQGIYVDILSGEPLFSSKHKFYSSSGWPSFYKPLESDNIVRRKDTSLFRTRIEVRSRHADSHLGHVFKDGPDPTGLRYCVNSAALEFVPVEELEQRGYEQYVSHFQPQS